MRKFTNPGAGGNGLNLFRTQTEITSSIIRLKKRVWNEIKHEALLEIPAHSWKDLLFCVPTLKEPRTIIVLRMAFWETCFSSYFRVGTLPAQERPLVKCMVIDPNTSVHWLVKHMSQCRSGKQCRTTSVFLLVVWVQTENVVLGGAPQGVGPLFHQK